MNTQQSNAQDHNIPAAQRDSGHAQEGNTQRSRPNAQDPYNVASPTPQDPTKPGRHPSEPVTIGPVNPGHTTPGAQDSEDDATEVDPHEVRTRLAVHGAVHGLELDTGSGVVFIPQHALPDLRRRLYLAQQRFTAMSGPTPGKRRRRPASAR